MSKIFKVENGLLTLDREELRLEPEFRKILERDRGSEGDADGRKKYRAFKEFHYIYMVADLGSPANQSGYNEKEVHKYAAKEAGLDESFKADEYIRNAIKSYREKQVERTPTLKLINSTLQTVRVSYRVSETIREGMEYVLEQMDKQKELALKTKQPINIAESLINAKALVEQLNIITKIANSIPETVKTLEDLQTKITKEESGIKMMRGGRAIPNRADPR